MYNPDCVSLLFIHERKTGEGDLRTSGVYQTGEACGTREKKDDILASRKEDVKMNGERRRMMEYRIQ